jgi:hypothetical protein
LISKIQIFLKMPPGQPAAFSIDLVQSGGVPQQRTGITGIDTAIAVPF